MCLRKGKNDVGIFCLFRFCLRMFLFFYKMKNEEEEKEEGTTEERDGRNIYGDGKHINGETRGRDMENVGSGTFFLKP